MIRIQIFIIVLHVIYWILTAWPEPYSFYIVWFLSSVFYCCLVFYNFSFHCSIHRCDISFFYSCGILIYNCNISFFLVIWIMLTGFVLNLEIFGVIICLIARNWIIRWTLIIPLTLCVIIIWDIQKSSICNLIRVILNSNSTLDQFNNAESWPLLLVQRNDWICVFARFDFGILILKILGEFRGITLKLGQVDFLVLLLVNWLHIILYLLFLSLFGYYWYTWHLRYW